MSKRKPMRDLIVVLPGIMGSVLVRDGLEVWGLSGRTALANLASLGGQVKQLKLPPRTADEDPEDGVQASALMPSAQIIPGFWNLIHGYSELVERLERVFELRRSSLREAGNLLLFPYDWRLSNRLNGRRLAKRARPALDRWREASGADDAKLVLIGHSMGGLVARWFLEKEGGKPLTRRLITLGTPYRGSVNALLNLANGFAPGLGPLRLRLDEVLRSFPSVYQLLPTYSCIEQEGEIRALWDLDVPGLEPAGVADARAFHDAIAKETAEAGYETSVVKGHAQPTFESARLTPDGLEGLRAYRDEENSGDGTVPGPSAHPPEWDEGKEGSILWTACQHGALQTAAATLDQIEGLLQHRLKRYLAESAGLGLDMPDLIGAGAPLPLEVVAHPRQDRLALRAIAIGEHGERRQSQQMRPAGDGRYGTFIAGLEPGAWRVTVGPADPQARNVVPVSGLTLAWSDSSASMSALPRVG